MILEAGLGPFTVPSQPFNFPNRGGHHVSPAQKRRRERREVALRAAATAQDTLNNEDVVEASKEVEAEQVSTTAEKAVDTLQAEMLQFKSLLLLVMLKKLKVLIMFIVINVTRNLET